VESGDSDTDFIWEFLERICGRYGNQDQSLYNRKTHKITVNTEVEVGRGKGESS
jgi:hypothetical protein